MEQNIKDELLRRHLAATKYSGKKWPILTKAREEKETKKTKEKRRRKLATDTAAAEFQDESRSMCLGLPQARALDLIPYTQPTEPEHLANDIDPGANATDVLLARSLWDPDDQLEEEDVGCCLVSGGRKTKRRRKKLRRTKRRRKTRRRKTRRTKRRAKKHRKRKSRKI